MTQKNQMLTVKLLMYLEKLKLCSDYELLEDYHTQRGYKASKSLSGF